MSVLKEKKAVDNVQVIDSRFGKITINPDKAIYFADGLLGMKGYRYFCLTSFPNEKYQAFKILQSIEDAGLSFAVLPLERIEESRNFSFFDAKDLEECLSTLGVSYEDAAAVLITSVHPIIGQNEVKVSVNVRAPLILDTKNRIGCQYVFQSNKYQIRQMLN